MTAFACPCLPMLVYASLCSSLSCLFGCLFACLLLVVVAVVMVALVLVFVVDLAFVVVPILSGQEPGLQVLDIPKHFYIIHC